MPMPIMPLRVALGGKASEEDEDPTGWRTAGKAVTGAAKGAAKRFSEFVGAHPAGALAPSPLPRMVEPTAPSAAVQPTPPPLPEPQKPVPNTVVSRAAAQAAAAYRSRGPAQPPAPAVPATVVPESGPRLRVRVPGKDWVNYSDATSEEIRSAMPDDQFALSRAGGRGLPPSLAGGAGEQGIVSYGAASPTGGHSEMVRRPSTPEAQVDWLRFKEGHDLEHLGMEEAAAGARAKTAAAEAEASRAGMLTLDPLAEARLTARAREAEPIMKGQIEATRRDRIFQVINEVNEKINDLYKNPRFAGMSPVQKEQLRDQYNREAELLLSALVGVNLSPKASNPFEGLIPAGTTAEPKKE